MITGARPPFYPASPGVDSLAVFDLLVDIPPQGPHPGIRDDWRWSSSMYRTWATL